MQRFDSALRLDVHLHVLWLDGVYGWEPGRGEPEFHAQHDPASIARVLGALGLSAGAVELAASRGPPGRDEGLAE